MTKGNAMSWRLLVVGAVTLVSLPQNALAYNLTQDSNQHALVWSKKSIDVLVDLTDSPLKEGTLEAVKASFQVWINGGLPYTLNIQASDGPVEVDRTSKDGLNVVKFITHNWPYEENRAAMTIVHANPDSGQIREVDIVLNAQHFTWTTDPGEGSLDFDLENVMVHEVGHFFGIAHSENEDATMYALVPLGEISKRDLNEDDLEGIAANLAVMDEVISTYGYDEEKIAGAQNTTADGTPTDETSEQPTVGGCSVGGSPNNSGMAFFTLFLLALYPLRRRA